MIFWRTPYNYSPLAGLNPARPNAMLKFALDAVPHDYVWINQNERGKFFSEGEWEILGRPRTDGWDALTWIAEQPWSSGRVASRTPSRIGTMTMRSTFASSPRLRWALRQLGFGSTSSNWFGLAPRRRAIDAVLHVKPWPRTRSSSTSTGP